MVSGHALCRGWKDSDNYIAEQSADGTMVARFIPTSAARTPDAIRDIRDRYARELGRGVYETLQASSIGWHDGKNDHLPFVTYMLGVMDACYHTLDERFSLLSASDSNEDILRSYFDGLIGKVTKCQIMDDNPVMSQHTV